MRCRQLSPLAPMVFPRPSSPLGYVIWDFVQVSAAPKHIALQLIERACSEHYIEAVLDDVESRQMPFTADMLNMMLGECIRIKTGRSQTH